MDLSIPASLPSIDMGTWKAHHAVIQLKVNVILGITLGSSKKPKI